MKASAALALALTALFVSVTTVSQAQVMLMARPKIDGGLVGNPVAQKELSLTDAQKTKLQDLMKKLSENHIEINGGSQEEMQQQLKEYADNTDKMVLDGLKAVLDEKQMTRFMQLNRQAQGIRGFTDKDAKTTLVLTDDQMKKLESITATYETEESELMSSLMQTSANGEMMVIGKEESKKIATLAAKFYDKGFEVLTPEQKTKWSEMIGTKVDLTNW
ncbi:MAG: hypothetical protein ABL949_15455 [Fimbriimonadaceae bacterium]